MKSFRSWYTFIQLNTFQVYGNNNLTKIGNRQMQRWGRRGIGKREELKWISKEWVLFVLTLLSFLQFLSMCVPVPSEFCFSMNEWASAQTNKNVVLPRRRIGRKLRINNNSCYLLEYCMNLLLLLLLHGWILPAAARHPLLIPLCVVVALRLSVGLVASLSLLVSPRPMLSNQLYNILCIIPRAFSTSSSSFLSRPKASDDNASLRSFARLYIQQ